MCFLFANKLHQNYRCASLSTSFYSLPSPRKLCLWGGGGVGGGILFFPGFFVVRPVRPSVRSLRFDFCKWVSNKHCLSTFLVWKGVLYWRFTINVKMFFLCVIDNVLSGTICLFCFCAASFSIQLILLRNLRITNAISIRKKNKKLDFWKYCIRMFAFGLFTAVIINH